MKAEGAGAVLVVADGDVIVRHAISDYLRDCGYVVIEAANSDEVQTLLTQPELRADAVLCDAAIEGRLSAFELRHWVAQSRPDCQVVLAGNVATAADKAADLCDEGPHLKRPYDPQGVVDYIKRLLA